jgi:hypothetical protein
MKPPKRDDEQKAEAVANLHECDDEAGRADIKAERVTDGTGERLRIVDIGDDDAASHGEQRNQPARNGGFGLFGRGNRVGRRGEQGRLL